MSIEAAGYSKGFTNFEPMRRKVRQDDDPRRIPAVKCRIPQLDEKLRLIIGKGDRAVIKLDKEYPEIPFARKEISIPDGSNVFVLGSQKGFLGLSLATIHPKSQFVLYDQNLINARIIDRNMRLNYFLKNVSLFGEQDFAEERGKKRFSHLIYSIPDYAPHEIIRDDISTGASFLAPHGSFLLITRTKSGGVRHGKILEEVLDSKSELIAREKGYRIYSSTLGKNIEVVRARRNINYSVLGHEIDVQTEPGLFSKDRLDEGTRTLLETVDLKKFNRLLDVGCGWGAMGITAAIHNPHGEIVMTDVDTRAVRVAKDNVERLGLSDRVNVVSVADAQEVHGSFDIILSNPPFHASVQDLSLLFKGVRTKLDRRASFYFVVEKSYASKLADIASDVFKNVTSIEQKTGKQYGVYSMHK